MKAYLLLENGFMVTGNLFGHSHNMLGELKVNKDGCLELDGVLFDEACMLTECSTSLKEGNSAFFSSDIDAIEAFLSEDSTTYAKLVIDSLDVEYHMYDLKTYVPSTHTAGYSKVGKEAA